MSAALVVLGDRLGLYKALAQGPATATELARRTGTAVRYIQEWLDAKASGGYVQYASDTQKYEVSPERAAALADDLSPAFVPGMFQIMQAMWKAVDHMEWR
jgi:DNA-binding IclR family transcriptional regulator